MPQFDTLFLSLTRTGTAIAQNIISSHPEVYMADYELQTILYPQNLSVNPPHARSKVVFVHDIKLMSYWGAIQSSLSCKNFIYTIRNPFDQLVGLYNAALYESSLGLYRTPTLESFFSHESLLEVFKYTANVMDYSETLSRHFENSYAIDFNMLKPDSVKGVCKDIYNFLNVDSTFYDEKFELTAFSDVVGLLSCTPVKLKLSRASVIDIFFTLENLAPRNGFFYKGHLGKNYKCLGTITMFDDRVRGLAGRELYMWLDVFQINNLSQGELSNFRCNFTQLFDKSFSEWIAGARDIEDFCSKTKIDSLPDEITARVLSIIGPQVRKFLKTHPRFHWPQFS